MKKIMQKKSGVALLWVLILSSILIIISSTMVSYIAKELRSSVRITSSATSYSFARSGITWAKYHIGTLGPEGVIDYSVEGGMTFNFDFDNNNTEETQVIIKSTPENHFVVKSTSDNNGVVRSIEYTIKESVKTFIPPSELNKINNPTPLAPLLRTGNNSSFEVSFVFWARDDSSQRFFIGASSVDQLGVAQRASSYILASLEATPQGTIMQIGARDTTGTIKLEQEQGELKWERERALEDVTRYIGYRGFLTYIEDTAASFRIERMDGACVGTINLDLEGIEFGNLDFLLINSGVASNYIYFPLTGATGDFGRNYLESPATNGVHIRDISIN